MVKVVDILKKNNTAWESVRVIMTHDKDAKLLSDMCLQIAF